MHQRRYYNKTLVYLHLPFPLSFKNIHSFPRVQNDVRICTSLARHLPSYYIEATDTVATPPPPFLHYNVYTHVPVIHTDTIRTSVIFSFLLFFPLSILFSSLLTHNSVWFVCIVLAKDVEFLRLCLGSTAGVGKEDRARVLRIVDQNDGINRARALRQVHVDRALAVLSELQESNARTRLENLLASLATRG